MRLASRRPRVTVLQDDAAHQGQQTDKSTTLSPGLRSESGEPARFRDR